VQHQLPVSLLEAAAGQLADAPLRRPLSHTLPSLERIGGLLWPGADGPIRIVRRPPVAAVHLHRRGTEVAPCPEKRAVPPVSGGGERRFTHEVILRVV
jgi:hypothetical protein